MVRLQPASQSGYTLLPTEELSPARGDSTVAPRAPSAADDGGDLEAAGTVRERRRANKDPLAASAASSDDGGGGAQVSSPSVGRKLEKTFFTYDGGISFKSNRTASCVIHPYNRRVHVWNICLALFLVMDVVILPLETAFGCYMNVMTMLLFNSLTTVVFTLDLLLQFFLQVPDPNGDFWIFNHRKIVRNYLTGFFFIDLLSVLPFGEVKVLLAASHHIGFYRSLYLLELARFLKLLRLRRLKRILSRYEFDLDISTTKRAIISWSIVMFIVLHVSSCFWATLANYQHGGYNWLVLLEEVKTRHGGTDFYVDPETGRPRPVLTFVVSVYFALYTVTGIGYGDLGATTIPEYLFLVIMMLVGSVIWATIIGEIVSIMKNGNVDEVTHQDRMDTLIDVCKHFPIDHDLHCRLRSYFLQSRRTYRVRFAEEEIMGRMSSESNDLAVQLAHVLHGSWFEQIWWLKRVRRTPFIVKFCLAFRPMLYCPGERVTPTERLYVIRRGVCIHGMQVLGKDRCWGADMLLTQAHLRQNLCTVAISFLDTLFLTRDDLLATMAQFPREEELIRKAYRCLCVMRGMVYHVRKLKQEEKRQARRLSTLGTSGAAADHTPALGKTVGRLSRTSSAFYGDIVAEPLSATSGVARLTSEDARNARREAANDGLVQQVQQQLCRLEEDMDSRLTAVEGRVGEALQLVSEALAAVNGGRGAGRGPSPPPQRFSLFSR